MAINYTPIDVTSGYNLADINANFVAVQTALLNALSLDGTTPNAMASDLDMDSNDILNGGVIRAASFVQNGTTLPLIEVGINWRGDWALATTYAAMDGVLNVGTTYRCILDHTSEASVTKPGTGSDWETYWAVLALKGTDGDGAGDMVKATYDSNDSGVVDTAEAVAFSGITSKPTTLSGYGITDSTLPDLAGVTFSANTGVYATGATTFATFSLTSFARTILDDSNGAAVRTTIGAGELGKLEGINTQTGSTYTLALTDIGKVVEMNNGSANTLTIPANSTVAFPINSKIDIVQYGAGTTTIAAAGGVTIRSSGSNLDIGGQYSGVTLYKRAANEWVLLGDLA